jgi:tyrosine-protein kinase Etk/Wzc
VQVNNDTYTGLLNQAQQLDIARAGTVGNVRIIDRSAVDVTNPVWPKKILVIFGGTLFGVFVALVYVFMREALNRGIEDPAVIERIGLPVYATIPVSVRERSLQGKRAKGDRKQHMLVMDAPKDLATEALRSLRTSLHFARLEAKNNVLMISGASPDVGKTFVAANLAALVAQSGQRVLLIDGDMRMGSLHRVVGGMANAGLSEIVSGQVELDEAVRKVASIDNLHFIARGKVPPNPSELLMNARFSALINHLKSRYDLVIIDSPPILVATDASVIGHHCGTSLLVVRFGINQLRELALAKQRFEQNGVAIKGAIFNAVEKRSSGYYSYAYYELGGAAS